MDGACLKEMNVLQTNKLSQIHDGKNIIFCKTDFILQDFEYIKSLSNDVVFITGSSDYAITDRVVALAPKNIKKWFCQNKGSNHPLLEAIPLGIESTVPCKREGHGYVHDFAHEKTERISSASLSTKPTQLIYSNFNVNTNPSLRIPVRDLCQKQEYITWSDPSLPYSQFVTDILNHKMAVSPEGNGIDCHRTWEVLSLGRVPIIKRNTALQDFETLPIIVVDSWDELEDLDWILFKYNSVKNNSLEMLDPDYWLERIKESVSL